MPLINKYIVRKFFIAMMWFILCSGTVVLLIAAITKKNNEHCTKVEISIKGVQNNFFLDKKDVIAILENKNGGSIESKPLHNIDLASMETALQKNLWIKNAELFFDNNDVLQVRVTEREPIARIFTVSGLSFYIDSSLKVLPLSDKFSPRLPVFSDFAADVNKLSRNDSALLSSIKTISEFIAANPFWMAQIDQIDILSNNEFDLIPKLGNNIIHFGNAENCDQKFNKLFIFYKQVLAKIGWNHYSTISVQFNNQVVGIKRGAQEIKMDSLHAIQIMKEIIAEAQKHTNDSTNIQLVQPADDNININHSTEKEIIPDENGNEKENSNVKNSVLVTPIHVPEKPHFAQHATVLQKPVVKKNIIKTPALKPPEKQKPKAVMPPKTDY